MAKKAKELGMDSLAISDHGTLAGWLMFRDACKKHSIKPIFGMEAYFVEEQTLVFKVNAEIDVLKEQIKTLKKSKNPEDKKTHEVLNIKHQEMLEARNKMRKYNHLILLAKNWTGCLALIRMHNAAVIDGSYYKNRLDWGVLEKHVNKGDVIASSACLGGVVAKCIEADDHQAALKNIERFNGIFGKGNFFLELQLNEINLQKKLNIELIKLSQATGTPLSLTCDSHFTEEGGHSTRALIRQLGEEDFSNNDDQLIDLYIKNEDMLFHSWKKYMPDVDIKYLAEAIKNTRKIADSIESFPFDTSLKFPIFETGNDDDQNIFLKKAAIKGLMAKNLHGKPEYIQRLKNELKTVEKLGFSSYFNVISDLVNNSRAEQPVGVGRGSGCGSLLGYCLGITNVDPLKFDLYFERFLDSSKGIIMPTFGLEIANLSIDVDKILKACECHTEKEGLII
jgi:DNA polymerase-3 subunit alpha